METHTASLSRLQGNGRSTGGHEDIGSSRSIPQDKAPGAGGVLVKLFLYGGAELLRQTCEVVADMCRKAKQSADGEKGSERLDEWQIGVMIFLEKVEMAKKTRIYSEGSSI